MPRVRATGVSTRCFGGAAAAVLITPSEEKANATIYDLSRVKDVNIANLSDIIQDMVLSFLFHAFLFLLPIISIGTRWSERGTTGTNPAHTIDINKSTLYYESSHDDGSYNKPRNETKPEASVTKAMTVLEGGSYEYDQNNNIYFIDALDETPIISADLRTFKQLKDASGGFVPYGRDKKGVYFGFRIIEGANPNTFKKGVYNDQYDMDDKSVFYMGIQYQETIVRDVDLSTFSVFTTSSGQSIYAADSINIFCAGKSLLNADRATFTLIEDNGFYAQDAINHFDTCNTLTLDNVP